MKSEDLVVHALGLLLRNDMAGFAALWAEDGVLEFPFAQPGAPRRVEGRAAVQEYLREYPDLLNVREIPEQVVHLTADPDVVVVEFTVNGVVVPTAKPYTMSYIAVITVRDGEIRHYRDYWSPAAAADVMGGLDSAFSGAADV
ncbi:nuclear transport factor 2 family protein [Umezawaea endophytica]|uniref:Nuclear transport factor 2 family protein n=1 Tax=Umezawaea endophytica TaxID=1654476 RepID=A0A9X2VL76_9PSEU|nr:nuclear transport factor 2 family protein [Umezawaea endophytica]MCS7478474.1 nuclear transport factor 2 family protein [Umezawaea endophytica]